MAHDVAEILQSINKKLEPYTNTNMLEEILKCLIEIRDTNASRLEALEDSLEQISSDIAQIKTDASLMQSDVSTMQSDVSNIEINTG